MVVVCGFLLEEASKEQSEVVESNVVVQCGVQVGLSGCFIYGYLHLSLYPILMLKDHSVRKSDPASMHLGYQSERSRENDQTNRNKQNTV